MNILTCFITHNRYELTKFSIESYLQTTMANHYLVVVDNASDDGKTKEYLRSLGKDIDFLVESEENLYPGKALNMGFEAGLEKFPQATYLHRSDNDIFFRQYWDAYALNVMKLFPEVGLFGLLEISEHYYPGFTPKIICDRDGFVVNKFHYPVGGSSIMRRSLWDEGIQYVEHKWHEEDQSNYWGEDQILCKHVKDHGYEYCHAFYPIAFHMGIWWGVRKPMSNLEYYERTYNERFLISLGDYEENFIKKPKSVYYHDPENLEIRSDA